MRRSCRLWCFRLTGLGTVATIVAHQLEDSVELGHQAVLEKSRGFLHKTVEDSPSPWWSEVYDQ